MKLYLCLITSSLLSLSAWSQSALFNNRGASIYMTPGSQMTVLNDSLHNFDGLIQNAGDINVTGSIINDDSLTGGGALATTGLYELGGNWVNNGTVISYQDSVMLSGDAQLITGSVVTAFHHLILAGTANSVKTQTLNATVDGILDLRNHELATQQYEMLVLNADPAAITKASGADGFVSSLDTGRLSRATNSTSAYLYPTGTPSSISTLPFYYRPVAMTPSSAAHNIYGARIVHDPTADSYDVAKLDDTLCRVNPLYYHRLYHSLGGTSAKIKMYYDDVNDGYWTQIAHWAASRWNYMGRSTIGSGYGLTSVEVSNWSNFSPHPFALGSKKFTLDAGPDQNIYSGQTVQLNPAIGLTSLDIDNVQWSPSTYLDYDNIKDPTASPTETIQYTVVVTDRSGCSLRDSLTLLLMPDLLLIPNAFSPNNDQLNDIFKPLNKNLTKIAFQIFDRWGEKVFETDGVGEGWDGTYKNVKQDIGVYVWKIQYQLEGSSTMRSESGNVTLVR
ncbi:MAG: gliding motility-associated C-terminal domain-containing protein [Bacteroidetes bacterium]|nr:gliding motility-associated C-terminal domain-containing protein [Bacteroidota bacterium]